MRPTASTAGYKLHCKPIPFLDPEALLKLPSTDPEVTNKLRQVLVWTTDAALYECAATDELEHTSLSVAEHDLQLKRSKIVIQNDPKGTCKPLKRAEHAKERFRGLQWPKLANKLTARHAPVNFTPYHERHSAILKGSWTIDLDWSAFFDQFQLSPEVSKYFSFVGKNGIVYSMNVLPMGLKHSVGVAQNATLQLLNYGPKSYTEAYVDNVRFVSDDKRQLVEDAVELVARCITAGVTINEIDTTGLRDMAPSKRKSTIRAKLQTLVKSKGSWLGEEYDYENKLVDLADKTKEKVKLCLDAKRPTFRTFAAAAGVLQYASRTLGIRLGPYFASVRAIAAVGWLMEQRPDLWDAKLPPMCPDVYKNLRNWRDTILATKPRRILREESPDIVIIVDASDEGWGAISVDELGRILYDARKWSTADRRAFNTKHSVRAEPEGIYRACCRFVRAEHHRTVHVASDSAAAVGAISKGHSRSYWMNHTVVKLDRTFPRTRFIFAHTPGATNPADGISRELSEPTAADRDMAIKIAEKARAAHTGG